jgi:hypothetical protein
MRAVLVVSCLAACGDNAATPLPDAGPASFAVTVAPNPIQEEPCGGCGPVTGQLWAVGMMTVTESAGVAGSVDAIGMRLTGASSQVIAEGSFDAAAVRALAGSNRVPAHGTLAIPHVGPHYDEAAGGNPATLRFTVDLVDDGGHAAQKIVDVPVTP